MRWYSRAVLIGVHSSFLSPSMISVHLLVPDSAALKAFDQKAKKDIFSCCMFSQVWGFFSDGDRYLATNIVKNVVSLPLWALKKECWLKVFSLVNQNKCKFLILGAVFPTFLLDIVWLPTSLAVEQLLTCSSRTQSGFGAVSWWVV